MRGVLVVLAMWWTTVVGDSVDTVYIENHCGSQRTFPVDTDFLLRYSGRRSLIPASYSCPMFVNAAEKSKQIQMHLIMLDTTYRSDCSLGAIVIQENGRYLTPSSGVCGGTPFKGIYRTSGPNVTITLTNRGRQSMYGDFKLLVTQVYQVPNNNTRCEGSDFLCDNGLCVSDHVICNGYDDCGDDSDEREGCELAVAAIVGIIIAALFVVFIFMIVIFCLRRQRRGGYTRITQVVREYPTVNEPVRSSNYVPSYFNQTTNTYQTM